MSVIKRVATILAATSLCLSFRAGAAPGMTSVKDIGLKGDGKADDTGALQAALDDGKTALCFPAGEYLIGAIKIPADSRVVFDPRARIKALPEKIQYTEEIEQNGKKRKVTRKKPLFTVSGDRVHLEGLRFDFASGGTEKAPIPVEVLVHAENVGDAVVSSFFVENSAHEKRRHGTDIVLFNAKDCRNVVLENSSATSISHMIRASQCANVSVRGNRMTGGSSMTTFAAGSENLRHHDNWSRNVGYQCVWRGGSPDPSRKAPRVPLGTANVVHRGSRQEDPDFIPHTQGIFDVMVQNNYAEYGTALCWGNKARQVVVDGNIARFMFDYSYGSEGDENTIFSNNISINSAVAGFMSLYWGEKVLICGNLVVVRHEPFVPELAKRPEPFYMGQFVRLHHGPSNPEDRYGAGGVKITGNLFVNELSDRPSGISIEAGRDVMISDNKIINGLVRKADEMARVKEEDAVKDADEFASQQAPSTGGSEAVKALRRVGRDLSRVTVIGNEFITRQAGEKPMLLINGSVSSAIVKNNVFRREDSIIAFTERQKEIEKELPRYMLFSEDDPGQRDFANSKPSVAVRIAPFTDNSAVVQGNVIRGWKQSISADNASPKGKALLVVTGNIVDGTVSVEGPDDRTVKKVEGNIDVPVGPAP